MYYYYDESGVSGFEYNGAKYHYIKNLQGDVVEIYVANGIRAVQYTYDAWGNVISTSGSLATTIGNYNPFRYRSYYYVAFFNPWLNCFTFVATSELLITVIYAVIMKLTSLDNIFKEGY